MKRADLEHIIRASAILPNDDEIVHPKNRPERWELIDGSIGELSPLCLEPHDLVVSKCIAGREKDLRFLDVALAHGLVNRETLLLRLAATRVDDLRKNAARERIERTK